VCIVYVCESLFLWVYVCVFVSMCVVFVCTCAYMCVRFLACLCVYDIYIGMHVCVLVYVCVCVQVLRFQHIWKILGAHKK
jgi:hypothetical protein